MSLWLMFYPYLTLMAAAIGVGVVYLISVFRRYEEEDSRD